VTIDVDLVVLERVQVQGVGAFKQPTLVERKQPVAERFAVVFVVVVVERLGRRSAGRWTAGVKGALPPLFRFGSQPPLDAQIRLR
jgi:hypothetical protein